MINPKMYKLIIKVDCPFCKKAVNLLTQNKIPFIVVAADKGDQFLQEQKSNYNWPTVPIVIAIDENNNETVIGGFTELNERISRNTGRILLND
jgi:glutaredoxin